VLTASYLLPFTLAYLTLDAGSGALPLFGAASSRCSPSALSGRVARGSAGAARRGGDRLRALLAPGRGGQHGAAPL
jgi:hypothetical protein